MSRLRRFLLALDVALGIGLFTGIKDGEYISTYVWRKRYRVRIALIDWWFGEGHCERSYEGQKKEGIVK